MGTIFIFSLEAVPSCCRASHESTSVNTTRQRWEDCVLGRALLFIITQHAESVQHLLSLGSVNIPSCRRAVMLSQCTSRQCGGARGVPRTAPSIQTDIGLLLYIYIYTNHFSGFCLIQHTNLQELASPLDCSERVCVTNRYIIQ